MGSEEQEREFVTPEMVKALPAGLDFYGKCFSHAPTLCYGPVSTYGLAQQWVAGHKKANPHHLPGVVVGVCP